MEIKAIIFRKDGFYTQPMVMGGEEGMEAYDLNVRYRGSLQNYLIDTGDEVILVGRIQTEPVLQGLQDSGFDPAHIRTVDGIEEAFSILFRAAVPEDTILLENDLPDAFNH